METKIFTLLIALWLLLGAIQFPLITILLTIYALGWLTYWFVNCR